MQYGKDMEIKEAHGLFFTLGNDASVIGKSAATAEVTFDLFMEDDPGLEYVTAWDMLGEAGAFKAFKEGMLS